ncbi:uncharacterized protein [Branchiostoma lanceolatum]|uniref:uncharacterized protein n=1 Tax=Branchiostoma lanceolatum TaxID=7740 RepID=UPI0034550353
MGNTRIPVYLLMTSLLMTLLALPTVESAPAPYDSHDRLNALQSLMKRLDEEDDSFPVDDREDDYSNKMASIIKDSLFDTEGYGAEGKGEELQKRGKKKKYRTICIDWAKGSWYWCWKNY